MLSFRIKLFGLFTQRAQYGPGHTSVAITIPIFVFFVLKNKEKANDNLAQLSTLLEISSKSKSNFITIAIAIANLPLLSVVNLSVILSPHTSMIGPLAWRGEVTQPSWAA